MAYLTIQINTDPSAAGVGPSVGDLNQLLAAGASNPHQVIQNILNLLDGITSGASSGSDISAVSSTVAGTVSGQTGGTSVSLNLR